MGTQVTTKFRIVLILQLIFLMGCGSPKRFFNAGSVSSTQGIEVIEIEMVNDLPLCMVMINGKPYRFLIDTGAPMVISQEIFADLELKENHTASVGDSQRNRQDQRFAVLPHIQIGNMVFEDIGCVVLTFENEVLQCYGFDGIVGANLMSKLYWKFDYANSRVFTSADLSLLDIDGFDFLLKFKPKRQKTPKIKGKVQGRVLDFTFDTGSNGRVEVPNDFEFYKGLSKGGDFLTREGATSIGIYGSGATDRSFEIKTDLHLGDQIFENELIGSGASALLGNTFLKDYVFVIDWANEKIHFKKNSNVDPKKLDGFGFSYVLNNGLFEVLTIIEEANTPIHIGDQVLAINDTDFTAMDSTDACHYFLNKVEKNFDEITVKVRRDNDTLNYNIQKRVFIE